jgi:hypothetical protein
LASGEVWERASELLETLDLHLEGKRVAGVNASLIAQAIVFASF